MTEQLEERPEVKTALATVGELEAYAGSFQVVTAEQFVAGADDLKRVKAAQKSIEDTRTSLTVPLNETLRRINALFRGPTERLARVEQIIKGKLLGYQQQQERQRAEAQRKLDEEAARERRRLQDIADRAAAKAREEEEKLRHEAEAAAAAGRAEEAERLAAKAATVAERAADKVEAFEQRAQTLVAPTVTVEQPKVAGLSTRENWVFTIVDVEKLDRKFMIPDEKKIGQLVRSMKRDAAAILGPGVKVENRPILAAGVARAS